MKLNMNVDHLLKLDSYDEKNMIFFVSYILIQIFFFFYETLINVLRTNIFLGFFFIFSSFCALSILRFSKIMLLKKLEQISIENTFLKIFDIFKNHEIFDENFSSFFKIMILDFFSNFFAKENIKIFMVKSYICCF